MNDIYINQIRWENISLLSIDIFDTLLFRLFENPSDLFDELYVKCIEQRLFSNSYDKNVFRLARIHAGMNIKDKRAKLHDIYSLMPNFEHKNQIIDLEIELERDSCFLNPSIVSLIYYAHSINIPIILTSDMYLSKEQITNILSHNGLNMSLIDELLISCEIGMSKREGTIYNYIAEKFHMFESQQILHIGDNFFSDYLQSTINNFSAIHYYVIPQKPLDEFHMEKLYNGEVIFPQILSIRKLATCLNKYIETEYEDWFYIGATIVGPFLALACEHMANVCIEKNIKNLYPLMREGALFTELLEEIFKCKNYLISIKPLYASRQSAFLANIESNATTILTNYADLLNLGFILSLLGLDITEEIEDLCELSPKIILKDYSLILRIDKYLSKTEHKEKMKKHYINKQQKLIDYMNAFNFDETYAFLDLGYKGMAINSIEKTIESTKKPKKIGYKILAISKTRHILNTGYSIDNLINFCEFSDILSSSYFLLENAMMNNEGSTVDYFYSENIIQPVIEKSYISQEQEKGVTACQEGIKLFFRLFLSFNNSIKIKLSEMRNEALKLFERIEFFPTRKESNMINEILHEDFGRVQKIADYITNDETAMHKVQSTYMNFYHVFHYLYRHDKALYRLVKKIDEAEDSLIVICGLNNNTISLIHLLSVFDKKVYAIYCTHLIENINVSNVPIKLINEIDKLNEKAIILIAEEDRQNVLTNKIMQICKDSSGCINLFTLEDKIFDNY